MHLANTSVTGSGPTGETVTLNLAVSFNREAAGKRYELQLAATDDLGHADQFTTAQQISVEPRKKGDSFER